MASPRPAVAPLAVVVTAGVGGLVLLTLRAGLPDLSHLDAMGSRPPPLGVAAAFTVGAFVLGAWLGLAPLLKWPRVAVALAAGCTGGAVAWSLAMKSAVDQTLASMTSGDSLLAALLISPLWLVMAVFALVSLLVFSSALAFALVVLADALSSRPRPLQVALLAAWAVDGVLLVPAVGQLASVLPPVVVEQQPAPLPPPPPPLCGDLPFKDELLHAGLRGVRGRLIAEGLELFVTGPADWTDDQLLAAAGHVIDPGACLAGGVETKVLLRAMDRVPVTLRVRAHLPRGADKTNFELMLGSHLRSAMEGGFDVLEGGRLATTVQDAWSLFPPGSVEPGFTCEPATEVRCEGFRIEVLAPGTLPKFGGVKVDYRR